jgi:hypothetical protein
MTTQYAKGLPVDFTIGSSEWDMVSYEQLFAWLPQLPLVFRSFTECTESNIGALAFFHSFHTFKPETFSQLTRLCINCIGNSPMADRLKSIHLPMLHHLQLLDYHNFGTLSKLLCPELRSLTLQHFVKKIDLRAEAWSRPQNPLDALPSQLHRFPKLAELLIFGSALQEAEHTSQTQNFKVKSLTISGRNSELALRPCLISFPKISTLSILTLGSILDLPNPDESTCLNDIHHLKLTLFCKVSDADDQADPLQGPALSYAHLIRLLPNLHELDIASPDLEFNFESVHPFCLFYYVREGCRQVIEANGPVFNDILSCLETLESPREATHHFSQLRHIRLTSVQFNLTLFTRLLEKITRDRPGERELAPLLTTRKCYWPEFGIYQIYMGDYDVIFPVPDVTNMAWSRFLELYGVNSSDEWKGLRRTRWGLFQGHS